MFLLLRLFYTQLLESEGEVETLSRVFLKNRNNFELYIPYTFNRQYSESTLNSYETIRKFFDVILALFAAIFVFLIGELFQKWSNYFKEINLRLNVTNKWISDYLNRPLDRVVQYRQFIQVTYYYVSLLSISNFSFNWRFVEK